MNEKQQSKKKSGSAWSSLLTLQFKTHAHTHKQRHNYLLQHWSINVKTSMYPQSKFIHHIHAVRTILMTNVETIITHRHCNYISTLAYHKFNYRLIESY